MTNDLHRLVPATRELDETPTRTRRSAVAAFIGGWILGPLLALMLISAFVAAIAFFVRLTIG